MIRTLAITTDLILKQDLPLEQLTGPDIDWYWVDFNAPTEEEAKLLSSHFHFHPLAIEDCLHVLQRPKVDHYEDMHFFVLHAISESTLKAAEVDMFVGPSYVVTFHYNELQEMDEAWSRICDNEILRINGPIYCAYLVMDKLVDQYFPSVHYLEDQLSEIDSNEANLPIEELMNQVFEIRSKLLKLRRTIVPMRDLLYRVVNSQRIEGLKEHHLYYTDIYDHLLKLSEMIEQNRDMTSDMRDSYLSINSNRMNRIMKTLTVITTIFMPLTFIAGIYGMNFVYMPELTWKGGYFIVIGIMAMIGLIMFLLFRKKGWFK
ncbi:magnesium/cobalt transporter CorA [Paenibacillus sp. GCM10023252]|uniref:magnesium/cobalt transporter CorA n=1 Tax=Paenibacillus sp. GCM10023252 TaxID=3252649 RepID=UPI00360E5B43